MMWRPLACAVILFTTTNALANTWQKDTLGNYTLVAKQEALMLVCDTKTVGVQPVYEPRIYLYPSCSIGCPGTSISDDTKLASIILDEKSFPTEILGGDMDGMLMKPATPEDFMETLTTAQHITVYSSQVKPNYIDFKDIENSDDLDQFMETCKAEGPRTPTDVTVTDIPPAN